MKTYQKIYKPKKSFGLKINNNFVRAKKALGQNFLKSALALNKIIEAGEIVAEDTILEIGPGKGILTEKLLEKANRVIAIEKDYELFLFLQNKFNNYINSSNLVLVHDDILKFDFDQYKLKPKSYKLIANIPYNITGAILKKFLTAKNQPSLMILMVQNEVAKRITARDKRESILSISVKAYAEPKIIMKVPARYFSPSPLVDSAIIAIKNISRKIFMENNIDEEQFWEIVRAGFAHKRKKLSSNLKKYGDSFSGYQGEPLVKTLGNKRAEELTLTDWINLAKTTYINKK